VSSGSFDKTERCGQRPDRLGRGGELVVVDCKTGRHSEHRRCPRFAGTGAVALAAERTLRHHCRRVELHHLPTGRVLSWEHPAESLQRHRAEGGEIAECSAAEAALGRRWPGRCGIAGSAGRGDGGAVGPPWSTRCSRRGRHTVRWCDFRAHCPEGSVRYPARSRGPACDLGRARFGPAAGRLSGATGGRAPSAAGCAGRRAGYDFTRRRLGVRRRRPGPVALDGRGQTRSTSNHTHFPLPDSIQPHRVASESTSCRPRPLWNPPSGRLCGAPSGLLSWTSIRTPVRMSRATSRSGG
jgi:hypothetical protein